MKKSENALELPVFNHDRCNTIAACYGKLSDSAAKIAAEETEKITLDLLDWCFNKEEKEGSVQLSQMIEKAFELSRNPIELFFCGMAISKLISDPMSTPTLPNLQMGMDAVDALETMKKMGEMQKPLEDLIKDLKEKVRGIQKRGEE